MWCSVVWCSVVWCSAVWCGVVWCGVVRCGVVWCSVMWEGGGCSIMGEWSSVGMRCKRRSSVKVIVMWNGT